MATVCASQGCDFVVLLGDNFYPSGVSSTTDSQWQTAFVTPYANVNVPFYAVLGNHDYGGGGAGTDFAKPANEVAYSQVNPKWRMPDTHYRFVEGDVEFFAADTNRSLFGLDDAVRTDFATWTAAAPTTTWRIAMGHHPYRSNGPHGNAGDYDPICIGSACVSSPSPINGEKVKSFLETSVCGKVDVYLCGHDHSRQWLTPTCAGTELIVSGAGGGGLTPVDQKNASYWQSDQLGFLYVVVQGRTFTGTFYSASGAVEFTRTITK